MLDPLALGGHPLHRARRGVALRREMPRPGKGNDGRGEAWDILQLSSSELSPQSLS